MLRSPRDAKGAISAIKTRPRAKPGKKRLKAKATYKGVVKIHERLSCKSNRTKEERLAWATAKMEESRAYFAAWLQFKTTDPRFANRIIDQLEDPYISQGKARGCTATKSGYADGRLEGVKGHQLWQRGWQLTLHPPNKQLYRYAIRTVREDSVGRK